MNKVFVVRVRNFDEAYSFDVFAICANEAVAEKKAEEAKRNYVTDTVIIDEVEVVSD